MSKKDEALKLALEALEFDGFTPEDATHRYYTTKATAAIREALAEQQLSELCRCGKQTMAWCMANTCSKAEQPAQQEVDWEKLYRLEVKKKEALAAKYERDTGQKLTRIVPMAKHQEGGA